MNSQIPLVFQLFTNSPSTPPLQGILLQTTQVTLAATAGDIALQCSAVAVGAAFKIIHKNKSKSKIK